MTTCLPGEAMRRLGGLPWAQRPEAVQQSAVVISWEIFVTRRTQLDTNPCYTPCPEHNCGENRPQRGQCDHGAEELRQEDRREDMAGPKPTGGCCEGGSVQVFLTCMVSHLCSSRPGTYRAYTGLLWAAQPGRYTCL